MHMGKKNVSLEKKIDNISKNIDALAISTAKGFNRLENNMGAEFKEVRELLNDINYRLSKIEGNHERRLDILEARMAVVKTFFEKNPKLKLKFT
jgi:nitrogenase molybdenum-iron protein alpha/beta subunit